jgi:hypothetical protein
MGMTLGPLALAASCSESFPKPIVVDASVGASTRTFATWCAPAGDPARCAGDDPGYVFYPPLACDPDGRDAAAEGSAGSDEDAADEGNTSDAGDEASADAGDDLASGDGASDGGSSDGGDGGLDPCALVTTLDVFSSPAMCQAFAAAEDGQSLASDLDPAAPSFDEPSDGDQLTPDNWSIFAWRKPARDARASPVKRALDFFEPSAHASSLEGDAYVLEFAQGCTEILRVMVADTFWQPDPASWTTLAAVDGPVIVRVVAMRFSGGALVGTPVPSIPITISMTSRDGR